MATSEGIPSSIDIEFLELNDNPYLMQRYKMKNKKRFPHVGNGKPEFYIILNY